MHDEQKIPMFVGIKVRKQKEKENGEMQSIRARNNYCTDFQNMTQHEMSCTCK